MQIKDVPVGSRVRVNIKGAYFDYMGDFDPNRPIIDGVLVRHANDHSLHALIAWREGEATTDPAFPYIEDGFASGAFISENTACVLAP